jgi:hypothetical protein
VDRQAPRRSVPPVGLVRDVCGLVALRIPNGAHNGALKIVD